MKWSEALLKAVYRLRENVIDNFPFVTRWFSAFIVTAILLSVTLAPIDINRNERTERRIEKSRADYLANIGLSINKLERSDNAIAIQQPQIDIKVVYPTEIRETDSFPVVAQYSINGATKTLTKLPSKESEGKVRLKSSGIDTTPDDDQEIDSKTTLPLPLTWSAFGKGAGNHEMLLIFDQSLVKPRPGYRPTSVTINNIPYTGDARFISLPITIYTKLGFTSWWADLADRIGAIIAVVLGMAIFERLIRVGIRKILRWYRGRP